MANRLTSNPIYFDQFDADVTLAVDGSPLIIKKIRCLSVADGDIFRLEDIAGNRLVHMVNKGANDDFETDFGPNGQIFTDGVVIDVSDCTGMAATDGTDAVWIYLK